MEVCRIVDLSYKTTARLQSASKQSVWGAHNSDRFSGRHLSGDQLVVQYKPVWQNSQGRPRVTISGFAKDDNTSWKSPNPGWNRLTGKGWWRKRRVGALGADGDVGQTSGERSKDLQDMLQNTTSDNVQEGPSRFFHALLRFAIDQFLPLALVLGVLLGYQWPGPGQVAHRWGLSRYTTFGIFFISGLTLKGGDVRKALGAWPALLYGLVCILAITPLAALAVLRLPLAPPELAAGLAVFCCVPTTLSSGVSLTQAVGANTALALGLTVASNLLGIVTMPFVLSALVGRGAGVSLPARPLLESLLRTLLLPLILGATVRTAVPGAAAAVDSHKKQLSMLSSAQLSLVPWMQVSASQVALTQVAPAQLLAAAVAGMGLHTAFLLWNSAAVKVLPLVLGSDRDECTRADVERAVIIVASQKTLPVTVAVVERLGGALGAPGLLLLPCIATHLSQVIMDSVLVSHWLEQERKGQLNQEPSGVKVA